MEFQTIRFEQKSAVASIVLNRPKAYNAFTLEMNQEIIAALKLAEKAREIRCIVITGNGNAFCSGEDLGGVDEHTNHAVFLRERYHPMMQAIRNFPKPIVAAVNGIAAGAGMSLALAADFRLVHPGTKFVSAFMNIGLVPDSGFMHILPRLVGYAKALEIAVLGKTISGKDAVKLGLATQLVDTDKWEENVEKFAVHIAALPTQAVALIKRYMLEGMQLSFTEALDLEAQAQRIAGRTYDHREGLAAFKEKRKPRFIGT